MLRYFFYGFAIVLISLSTARLSSQDINFKNFQALENGLFFLEVDGNSVLGKYYDSKNKRVVKDVIRQGRGPFEIENIGSFSYDNHSKRLFVADVSNGKIISYNENGTPLLENLVKIPYIINIDSFKEQLVISQGILLRSSKNISNYPIGFLLNQNKLEVNDTLFFNLSSLDFDKIKNSSKVKIFEIRPTIISLKNDLYLVTFQGVKSIILIDKKSNVLDSSTIDVPNYKGMKVVEHPSYGFGQTKYSVFNDYVRSEDGIYLSFGHSSKDIPFGIVDVSFASDNKLKTKVYLLDGNENLSNNFIITIDGENIYGTNGSEIFPLTFK